MNTPLFKQIKAVQTARKALERRTMLGDPFPESEEYYKELDAALNDAGSTLAALNLNPDREKRIKELEFALQEIIIENYDDDDKKRHLTSIIDRMKSIATAHLNFDAAISGFASLEELTKVKYDRVVELENKVERLEKSLRDMLEAYSPRSLTSMSSEDRGEILQVAHELTKVK